MIIYLNKSTLFTVDPDTRFARIYGVPLGTLKEMYRRHKLMEYSTKDLCDFYNLRTNNRIAGKAMKRWLWRTEVYVMARPALDKGATTVLSSFFKKYEWKVIKEIVKNLKTSVHGKNRTLI